MMSRQHALAGAATWVAGFPLVPLGLTTGQVVVGGALAVGASLVPDLDMPGSAAARTYGPITRALAAVVTFIARGHRWGTHCLLGLVLTVVVALLVTLSGVALALTTWLLLGFAVRGLGMTDTDGPGHIRGPRLARYLFGAVTNGIAMAFVTTLLYISGVNIVAVLPWAVGIGAASHIFTDCLTDKGCPLGYPFSTERYRLPLFTTGSALSGPALTMFLAVCFAALTAVRIA